MELIDFEIAKKLLSPTLGALGGWVLRQLAQLLYSRHFIVRAAFAWRRSLWIRIGTYLLAASALAFVATLVGRKFGYPIDALAFTLAMALTLMILDRWRLAKVGIADADVTITGGIDYHGALKLCHSELWFLGTGASKLTKDPEFEDAIKRCTGSRHAVRFLLTAPDNDVLTSAEKQAQATSTSYVNAVRESLQRLRRLRVERDMSIEVRFYSQTKATAVQQFRMMFINGQTLLLSYNLYGQGDGSNTPQIIVQKSLIADEKTGFYYPLRQYYERLWENSTQWDFKKYVDQ